MKKTPCAQCGSPRLDQRRRRRRRDTGLCQACCRKLSPTARALLFNEQLATVHDAVASASAQGAHEVTLPIQTLRVALGVPS